MFARGFNYLNSNTTYILSYIWCNISDSQSELSANHKFLSFMNLDSNSGLKSTWSVFNQYNDAYNTMHILNLIQF